MVGRAPLSRHPPAGHRRADDGARVRALLSARSGRSLLTQRSPPTNSGHSAKVATGREEGAHGPERAWPESATFTRTSHSGGRASIRRAMRAARLEPATSARPSLRDALVGRADRGDRRAGHQLPRLSRCAWRPRQLLPSSSMCTGAPACPADDAARGWSARTRVDGRRTVFCAALPAVDGSASAWPRVSAAARRALLERRPTSDEQVAGHARQGPRRRCRPARRVSHAGDRRRGPLRRQVETHSSPAAELLPRAPIPKTRALGILREAERDRLGVRAQRVRRAALELRLIKRFRPRFNVALKRDAHNYAFIKVTRGPAPKLAVVRSAGQRRRRHVLRAVSRALSASTEALRELNDALALRDCAHDTPMFFSDQPELFASAAAHSGLHPPRDPQVPGPCIGACSERQYAGPRGTGARVFRGADDGPIASLTDGDAGCQRRGSSSSAPRRLRDKLQRLEVLREQFARLRFAVETLSFVYTVPGDDGEDRVYLIRRGCVRADAADSAYPASSGTRCTTSRRASSLSPDGRRRPCRHTKSMS